ncbi:MAG: hypothetical protein ABF826_08210 [Komagataeibacter saccharivorans]|nr:hypothetical protein [Komagataeibacter saccharivorans]
MSKATFTIAYDGPALKNHAMDVRALAPALLGFGTLFEAANSTLNGESAKTKVQVTALESGSFQISFEVVQTFYSHIVAILSGPTISAAANLQSLLGFGGVIGGIIYLIKKFRGKSPDKVTPLKDGMVRLQYGDETVDIPIECLKLLQSLPVRDALQKIIEEPLKMDGIEVFEVRSGGKTIESINRSESVYFARPSVPDEILVDDHRRAAFSIMALAFKDDNKWRLFDGTNTISASIEDHDFLRRVNLNEVSFSKGDVLVCDIHIIQKQTDNGLKTEYTVEKVIDHKPAARQIPFDFE